ncbi:MAG TPA: hypothetical protein ENF43_00115 [Thermoplasmatales archaeon]|nr:hypothetical protein [Thermoplasmatales archaeon]
MRRAGVVAVCSALVLVGVLSAVTNPASASPKAEAKLYKIYGWVTDKCTGEGIKGVCIEVWDENWELINFTHTNDTGYYEILVENDLYFIRAGTAGYTTNSTIVYVTKDVCVNFTLLKLTIVSGCVSDAKTGRGIKGAKVVLFEMNWTLSPILLAILYRLHLVNLPIPPYLDMADRTSTTDEGKYLLGYREFWTLKPGTYTLLVMKFGYIPETKVITFREYGEELEVNFTLNRIIPI